MFFFMGNFDDEIKGQIFSFERGGIILIENIRYFIEETDDKEISLKNWLL